ncbi:MAG: hypothetical protein KAI83_20270 [Thiomargarita sp.]|nr:hypothetical protein [Thiomargarita sp.]
MSTNPPAFFAKPVSAKLTESEREKMQLSDAAADIKKKKELTRYKETEPVSIPTFPCLIKKITVSQNGNIELTLSIQDFPVEDERASIYGKRDGTGSVGGILMYVNAHCLEIIADLNAIIKTENV